jgi:hypothetical protein
LHKPDTSQLSLDGSCALAPSSSLLGGDDPRGTAHCHLSSPALSAPHQNSAKQRTILWRDFCFNLVQIW